MLMVSETKINFTLFSVVIAFFRFPEKTKKPKNYFLPFICWKKPLDESGNVSLGDIQIKRDIRDNHVGCDIFS